MATTSVGEHLRAHLLSSASGYCTSSNTFVGIVRDAREPAIPHKSVWILEIAGPQPHRFMDGNSKNYRYVDVQVRIRGNPGDYADAHDLANRVWNGLQGATTITTNYVAIRATTSAPMPMGYSEKDEPEFSLRFRVEKKE